MPKIEIDEEYSIVYDDNPSVRDEVFKKLIEWYTEYNAFDGEMIVQCDNPQIYAPVVLSEIAENIIKFRYEDN